MIRQRTQLKRLLWTVQQRQQTTAAAANVKVGGDSEAALELQQARPYDEIPKVGKLNFVLSMLPGGKYHKMQFPDILLDLRKQHGPLFRLPGIMNNPETVVSHTPSDFERVYRVEGVWPERPGMELNRYYRSVLRKDIYQGIEGVITTKGQKWGSFRSSVNPVMMQPKTVRLYFQKMSLVNKEFIERIREIRDSNTFEVPDTFEEEINRWTLESVSVVALDKQLGLMKENRDNPQAKKLFDSLNNFFTLAPEIEYSPSLWKYFPTPTFKKLVKAMDDIQEVTNGYVNEALERMERNPSNKPEQEQSVLEKLVKIDKRVAIVMATDMLMAGVDTTTTTFTGALLCLAKNPEKQAKLREEMMRILPEKDSEFTEASMKNVPYLRACIKEALRIYPLAPGNGRVIKSDVALGGYRVPAETPVLMLSYGLLMNDQHYPRGSEFLPERWLRQDKESEGDLKASSPFIYLPFGFGPRMCIGKRIVEMELELGIARLIRNYHVEFNYSTENAFKNMLINVPNIPLKFKFTDVKQ